jgi:carboxymethylenebutenolidase
LIERRRLNAAHREKRDMCDDEIHQGIASDPAVTRRAFGLLAGAIAAGASGLAAAAVKVVETDVNVKTPAGVSDSALFYPDGKGMWPAVLLWPDVTGLRPVFREKARRLAAEGYVVLVVNPYYRGAKATETAGLDFAKPDDRAKLGQYRLSTDQVDVDNAAYMAFLDAQPQTNRRAKAGTMGHCMSGPFTFRAAAKLPARIGAAASFHGGGLTTDTPDSPHLLIPQMKAHMLVAIAANDDERQPQSKDILKKAFADARVPATVEVYPGCNHGWTVAGSAAYNEPGAERAWSELLKLYKTSLV